MTTKTTTARSLPSCAPARLNPNRSEFNYRYVRLHKVNAACKLGYMPLPDIMLGYTYEFDSMVCEWLCNCKEPDEI
jgi:hypothetical protein